MTLLTIQSSKTYLIPIIVLNLFTLLFGLIFLFAPFPGLDSGSALRISLACVFIGFGILLSFKLWKRMAYTFELFSSHFAIKFLKNTYEFYWNEIRKLEFYFAGRERTTLITDDNDLGEFKLIIKQLDRKNTFKLYNIPMESVKKAVEMIEMLGKKSEYEIVRELPYKAVYWSFDTQ